MDKRRGSNGGTHNHRKPIFTETGGKRGRARASEFVVCVISRSLRQMEALTGILVRDGNTFDSR